MSGSTRPRDNRPPTKPRGGGAPPTQPTPKRVIRAEAGESRHEFIRRVVDSAPVPSPEVMDRLRRLLPPVPASVGTPVRVP